MAVAGKQPSAGGSVQTAGHVVINSVWMADTIAAVFVDVGQEPSMDVAAAFADDIAAVLVDIGHKQLAVAVEIMEIDGTEIAVEPGPNNRLSQPGPNNCLSQPGPKTVFAKNNGRRVLGRRPHTFRTLLLLAVASTPVEHISC